MDKILLIDDDKDMLKTMGDYLRCHGLDVDILDDTSQAFSRIREDDYDLIICSLLSRPIDGCQLSAAIRSSDEPKIKDIPIILTTKENPYTGDYIFMKKNRLYSINRFDSITTWVDKIRVILIKHKGHRE